MQILLDEKGIDQCLRRLADEFVDSIPEGCPVAIIGIRQRGDDLARRLQALLHRTGCAEPELGSLDITLYRDDLAEIGPSAVVRTTEIAFDVSGRYIILVDDVIFTGRSIRAALDAIVDLGRPRAIRLAVLVDRGGRELPIQPDFVGVRSEGRDRHVTVHLREKSGFDRVEVSP
jgi:pyrimidine operon attenuation protein/uracil phosphoribosyltransferase